MENNDIESKKNALADRIKKTKYCRINAYKRCNDWKNFLVVLSFFYNMCLIVISILSISVFKEVYYLNITITVLSVIVFTISLFISSLDYSRKANEYCRCYETLDEVINDLKTVKDEVELKRVESKYDTIISFSINHEECDYYRFKFEYPDGPKSFLIMDDGTKLSESDANIRADKERLKIAKKHKKFVAKTEIVKAVLTGIIFYPIFKFLILIFKGKTKNDKA